MIKLLICDDQYVVREGLSVSDHTQAAVLALRCGLVD